MQIRPTQGTIFDLVRRGVRFNTGKLVRAQEQVASGRRILRPSDDAVGTSIALTLRRQIGELETFVAAAQGARPSVQTANTRLQDGSNLLADARALIVQGMNGALGPRDRESIAQQLDLLYNQLLDVANARNGDRFLFAGTATDTQPFRIERGGTGRVAHYEGNSETQRVLVGRDTPLETALPGDAIFARYAYSGTEYGGLTGVASGTTADSGVGYESLHVRQDGTSGAMSQGVALVNGGADTVVGPHALTVDGTAGTVQLGTGDPVPIPTPAPSDLVAYDADGSEVHLDFTGWTGVGFTTTVDGTASVSLDEVNYTPIALTETDLLVQDAETGASIHVDTTGITRAARELVTFAGTPNVFDTIQGAIEDLRNPEGVGSGTTIARLSTRLGELDRSHDDLLLALGKLGTTSQRIDVSEDRLEDLRVTLNGLVSGIEDADFSEIVLDLSRAEQTLQLAQATGARVIQQSLLNYLR